MSICQKNECTGCSACANICPKNCIEMQYDEEGFLFPKIDAKKCINCGLCKKICPANTNFSAENQEKPKVIAAYANDKEILKNSSSGGIFSILSDWILKQNGVIFGAKLHKNMEFFHVKAENKKSYEEMRGSKYIQSEIRETYKEAKNAIENGRKVLFVGCPCQIAGLYSVLNKKPENLITVDLICHGVGSRKFFNKYIQEKEKKYKDKIKYISFRDKKYGYSRYTTKIIFNNRKPKYIKAYRDSYMASYMKLGIYRESCYNCKFAKIPRVGDITLGDFKGIKDKKMIENFEKGISVVLLNNSKANKIFEEIKDKIQWVERPLEEAISSNMNITKPNKRPDSRNYILKEEGSTNKLQKKYHKIRFREHIANILGRKLTKKLIKIVKGK